MGASPEEEEMNVLATSELDAWRSCMEAKSEYEGVAEVLLFESTETPTR